MQTVTSNTPQQINSALFALDKSIKELNTAINVIEKALKENDATLLEKINEKVNKADVVDAVTDGDLNPVTSNAVYDGLSSKVNTSDVVDRIEVNNSNPITSNAVAGALSFSEEEKIIGTWLDGQTLYQKTVRLNVPSNGEYQIVIPNNEKVKDWRGNYFHISESNPSFIMHIPYTYLSGTPIQDWLMIYVYAQGNVFVCNFQGGGQYETGYFNGVAVITYKYIKS